jgi:hypothetical protein
MSQKTVVGLPKSSKLEIGDYLNINARLYRQVSKLLEQLEEGEHVTLRERIQALVAVGRVQVIFLNLRKEQLGDDEPGSTIKKYAAAFRKNGPGRRATSARAAARPEPEPDGGWEGNADADFDDGDTAA